MRKRGNIGRKFEDLLITGAVKKDRKEGPVTKVSVYYSVDDGIRELWKRAEVGKVHYDRTLSIPQRKK